ncbi:TIR domain-containing protein [Haloferax sp. S1W]|uniref:TIR domain-containing protein n=1 Tax=Haloferax sp. S1W TaxID=3377110 RepID=UPI0037CC7286
MARRVFFSYHFQRDVWRANQVRNSWVTHPDREAAGFFDAAEQEEAKRQTKKAIENWIDGQLGHTSVTAVLIGEETAERQYVQYEVEQSIKRGNALLGIRIDSLKNRYGNRGTRGENPLDHYYVDTESGEVKLSSIFPTYRWKEDYGKQNMSEWVEEAVESRSAIPAEKRDTLKHNPDKKSLATQLIEGGVVVGGAILLARGVKEVGDALRQNQFR